MVLRLKVLLTHDEHGQLTAQLFDHVLNLLCLQFNWPQVLLRHYVRVVHCLYTSLNQERVSLLRLRILILNADLIVATVEGSKVVSHGLLITHSLDFLATRVRDGQDQATAVRLNLDDSYMKEK